MRDDLVLALRRAGIHTDSLNPLQRILLTTDGTVTDTLEAYYREPMEVVPLAQDEVPSAGDVAELGIHAGEPLLSREILLRGTVSGRAVLYATTSIVLGRLDVRLREGLLGKKLAIGHLLLRDRLETFREIIACGREPSGALSSHFGIYPQAPLLYRTYVVQLRGAPLMRITEKFPEWGM